MYFIYSFLLSLLLPFAYLRLLYKSLFLKSYRQRIAERFGINSSKKEPVDIWLHAVSLGEVNAAMVLIDRLLAQNQRLLITTMTPTGSQRVLSLYGDKVQHQYIPYDLPWLMKRFLQHWRPKKALVMETELWPNLIRQVHKQNIPLFLINARLSDHSYQGYKRFKFFFRRLLDCFTGILTQSEADSTRFKSLVSDMGIVHMLGNLKFDIEVKENQPEVYSFKKENHPVVMLASTHDNEEEQLLDVWSDIKTEYPGAQLLIAPRHPERFLPVFELVKKRGYAAQLRSELKADDVFDVLIINKIGELMDWYRLADFAVVGGSFIQLGGHNVIEPVALAVPTFSGPHISNFRAVCKALQDAGALKIVDNMEALKKDILDLYQNVAEQNQMKENCLKVMKESRGAADRYVDFVKQAKD